MRETDLYPPVKAFLEGQGYQVKGEVQDCDVVAIRGDEPPVIIELKTTFSLALVLQGVVRQGISEDVYLAIPKLGGGRKRRQQVLELCRRLGMGLLVVRTKPTPFVDVVLDPGPYQPRTRKARLGRLLREFQHRVGDPSAGGGNKRPVMTAYRQDALRCVILLNRDGPKKASIVAKETGVEKAAQILLRDVYGWFERVERGIYQLSPKGQAALESWADAVDDLKQASE